MLCWFLIEGSLQCVIVNQSIHVSRTCNRLPRVSLALPDPHWSLSHEVRIRAVSFQVLKFARSRSRYRDLLQTLLDPAWSNSRDLDSPGGQERLVGV
jgi:hypothetical protein